MAYGGKFMKPDPVHHTIIATDVAKSGSRTDPLIIRMRADLRQILEETLGRAESQLRPSLGGRSR